MVASPSVTLAITGDVMLGRLVNEVIASRGFAHPWGDVLPLLYRADLRLINLECALTTWPYPWTNGARKLFSFRADPSTEAALRIGRIDFASLANNHSLDFGQEGLRETIETLDRAGIAHAGAGLDLTSARAPALLTAGSVRVAVVAFADQLVEWAATPTMRGVNYTPISCDPEDFDAVEHAIAAARHGADMVVFAIHWGPNMRSRPTPGFQAFARKVIDAGADVFWGHSAHVVQGIEVYRGRPILYDTGDFIDDYAVDNDLRNDLSALFLVRASPPVIEAVEAVPVQIRDMQATLARGAERAWFQQRLAALCGEMGTEVAREGGVLTVRVDPSQTAAERRETA